MLKTVRPMIWKTPTNIKKKIAAAAIRFMPQDQQVCVLLQVLRGDQLYKAIAVVSAGQENGADTQRFINSFALLPL